MADSPIQYPAGGLERAAAFIGDIARPISLALLSAAASIATVVIATKVKDGDDGAFFIAAVFAGLSAIFIGKAVEVFKSHKATVEARSAEAIAAASAAPPTSPDPR